MNAVHHVPEPGQLVDVRRRRYVVIDVKQGPVGNSLAVRQRLHLVSLSSVEDNALGEQLQVIWEIEPGATTIDKVPLPEPVGFDTPHRLDTFLNAVRWGAASSADTKAIQAPFRSGIDLEDYQLDPVARAITMPRVNLLIADDVGLGKTIEAGLVAQELIIRHSVRRILIVCPAALQVQWRDQMQDKFGLEFRIIDSKAVSELRRERGIHINPWNHFPRLITSIDYLKRERPLRLFGEVLPREGESLYPRRFDLLILDEAHNVAPAGRGKYKTDSQRTRVLRRLTPHFEHKLFLTATPHNGYRESFTALLELLDNQRFARGVEPDDEQLRTIMIRRLKSEFKDWDGSSRFARREIHYIPVTYPQQERDIHQALQHYAEKRIARARAEHDIQQLYVTEFVAKLLKKRLFSSPAAFARTLNKHIQSLATSKQQTTMGRRAGSSVVREKFEQIEEEHDDDEALLDETDEALELSAQLLSELEEGERNLLTSMLNWAEKAGNRVDSKAQCLIDWLHQTIKPRGRWSQERVIIFTEYRDTQKWLEHQLAIEGFAERGPDGEKRLLTLYGGMDTKEREEIKAAFQANPTDASVRILLATDAASEGIDLQNHCSRLIHYEIPWNPNRLEQRNGRIDRHGQRAPQVNIYHFVSSTYQSAQKSKLDDDLEFLKQAVDKIERIREDLGNVGPVIAEQVEKAMLGSHYVLDTQEEEENAPSRKLRAFERKKLERLKERVQQLYQQLLEGKNELGMIPANIQAVVEIALELAGQPPLQKRQLEDPHGHYKPIMVFDVPELSGSWNRCGEGLEHPHTRQRRPIVFDHLLAKGRDDVVLAHLNHRLVAMSLRLLRAEIWSNGNQRKLYRVTARLVPAYALDTPVVIAHARLLLLGGDNQRLHEELIAAGGYLREGRFARMNETQLKAAQAAALDQAVPEAMQQRLANLWERQRDSLAQSLEVRMRERVASLQKALADRALKEQSDITTILTELKGQIAQELHQPEGPVQLQLEGFSTDERQQYEHNLRALQERLGQIDDEIAQEVERIQRRFDDPQARLFPVAVTYLVPMQLVR